MQNPTDIFPSLARLPSNPSVYLLTAQQYHHLHTLHSNLHRIHGDLSSRLFPWLHGVEWLSTSNFVPKPSYRGLTTLTCDPPFFTPSYPTSSHSLSSSSQTPTLSSASANHNHHSTTSVSSYGRSSNGSIENDTASLFSFESVETESSDVEEYGVVVAAKVANARVANLKLSGMCCATAISDDLDRLQIQDGLEEESQNCVSKIVLPSPTLFSILRAEDVLAQLSQSKGSHSGTTPTLSQACSSPTTPTKAGGDYEVDSDDSLEEEERRWIGRFVDPILQRSDAFNCRNFKLQPGQYARISDIVVFTRNGLDVKEGQNLVKEQERAIEVAEKLVEAIEVERQRAGGEEVYNVYIISDPIETFEKEYPELVAVGSDGKVRVKVDFYEREREEMRKLTRRSEIRKNVWMGNTLGDAPTHINLEQSPNPFDSIPLSNRSISKSSVNSNESSQGDSGFSLNLEDFQEGQIQEVNPDHFSICIECGECTTMPDDDFLMDVDAALDAIEDEQMNLGYQSEIQVPIQGGGGKEKIKKVWNVQDVVHMESVGTSLMLQKELKVFIRFIEDVIRLVIWIRDQAREKGRRILLHCSDGYTESSLLGLTYVMLDRKCSLPEAYLYLQNECKRSFFVFKDDLDILKALEKRVAGVVKKEEEKKERRRRKEREGRMLMQQNLDESGIIDTSSNASHLRGSGSGNGESGPEEKSGIFRDILSNSKTHAWFYDLNFEGQFPSRILPNLLLGNLQHASNPKMLKELGITHVVSVGESLLTLLKNGFGHGMMGMSRENSLYWEHKQGRIKVLDLKNINDDGKDSILPHLEKAVEYIDAAIKEGGKVLVHCRVGVSRSATVVIGYVMKFCELDLVSAYLLVRSRRLNIVIQPNCKIMWELWVWEGKLEEERRKRKRCIEVQVEGEEGEEEVRRMSWSCLAKEIGSLNGRYNC